MAGFHHTRSHHLDCGIHFRHILHIEHVLSRPMGGYPSIRHSEIRDTTNHWMFEDCSNDCIEPTLQPIKVKSSMVPQTTEDGPRLDITANGFWGGCYRRTFFDIHVFNSHAPSSYQPSLQATYKKHEKTKKQFTNKEYEKSSRASLPHLSCP